MNIQQLRFICEVARHGLKISKVADVLHTSQPGVSTQIRLLEEELGLAIFSRQRNRLVDITPAGSEVIERAQRALLEIDEIRKVGKAHSQEESGNLIIAASHTQARFRLPETLSRFVKAFPKVRITIRPDRGSQIHDVLRSGGADIGIMSSVENIRGDLLAIPFQTYGRVLLVPEGHALLKVAKPSMSDITRYPNVLCESSQTATMVTKELEQFWGSNPTMVMGANADIVKAYVELGLGISVQPEIVYNEERDVKLRAINVDHLFEKSTTYIILNRKHYLRAFAYAFIEILAPQITKAVVQDAFAHPR